MLSFVQQSLKKEEKYKSGGGNLQDVRRASKLVMDWKQLVIYIGSARTFYAAQLVLRALYVLNIVNTVTPLLLHTTAA